MVNFNSHAHVERDIGNFTCTTKIPISTHTLTWSVTTYQINYLTFLFHFNSHAHVERDCDVKHCHGIVANFNSHAHVERDS